MRSYGSFAGLEEENEDPRSLSLGTFFEIFGIFNFI